MIITGLSIFYCLDDDYDEHLEKNKNENKDIIRSRFELKEA